MGFWNTIGRVLNPLTAFDELGKIDEQIPSTDPSDLMETMPEIGFAQMENAWNAAVESVKGNGTKVVPEGNKHLPIKKVEMKKGK